jgi:hypothetical protein
MRSLLPLTYLFFLQKNTFFERTGKNAVQRASMQMDVYVEGITLYAGQVMHNYFASYQIESNAETDKKHSGWRSWRRCRAHRSWCTASDLGCQVRNGRQKWRWKIHLLESSCVPLYPSPQLHACDPRGTGAPSPQSLCQRFLDAYFQSRISGTAWPSMVLELNTPALVLTIFRMTNGGVLVSGLPMTRTMLTWI